MNQSETLLKCNIEKTSTQDKEKLLLTTLVVATATFFLLSDPVFASTNELKVIIQAILDNVVYPLFTGIGILMSFVAAGYLILSLKNSDPERQSTATATLIVGIAMVSLRFLMEKVDLLKYL